MANGVKIQIRSTDVKSIKYDNNFSGNAAEPKKLEVKSTLGIRLNPEEPLSAVVGVKFIAKTEDDSMVFELETLTMVSASTFVDNLDDVIKANYLAPIMLGVNERVKAVSSALGLNLNVPPISFEYNK